MGEERERERERERIAQKYRFGRQKKTIVPMTSISERENNFALLFFVILALSTVENVLKMGFPHPMTNGPWYFTLTLLHDFLS